MILIITTQHAWCDTRIYSKITSSLIKKDQKVHLITGNLKSIESITDVDFFTYEFVPLTSSRLKQLIFFIRKGIKLKPNVVLCIEPVTMFAGFFLKKILKCRVVYDAHEFYAEAFAERHKSYYKLYLFVEKLIASKLDAIIAVNDILCDRFKPNSFLCANFPNKDSFIDFKKEHITSTIQERSPKYDAVYVGCLWFERGLKIYLETAKLFAINNKPFKLLLIGTFKDTFTETFFYDFIKINKLENFICYKPFIPNNKALKEMQLARVGLFLGDIKASPRYDKSISMKILEYFSQGIPVIINNLSVLSDFVLESRGGWVINYKSSDLYKLLTEIIGNEVLLKEKALNGYCYVYENAIWESQEKILYEAMFG